MKRPAGPFRWRTTWLCVACAGLAAFTVGQAKYVIKSGSKPIGKATLTQKLLENGGKSVQLSLELNGQGTKTVSVRATTTYDAKGALVRQFLESVGSNPPSRRQITATFDATGAHLVVDDSGARQVKDVPLTQAAPKQDASQFWFIRDKPKLGATTTYYRFDPDAMSWSLNKTVYVGPKDVTFGTSTHKGHLIKDDRSETILDEAGLPLRITVGGVVFERVFGAP